MRDWIFLRRKENYSPKVFVEKYFFYFTMVVILQMRFYRYKYLFYRAAPILVD